MKYQKKFVRILCVILATVMFVGLLAPILSTVWAETPSEKLDRLREEQKVIKQQIDANKNDISKQEKNKQYFKQESNSIASQIEVMRGQIDATKVDLAAKQASLEQKVTEVAQAKAMFEDRLLAMYMNHNRSSLSTLLGVSSFAEALRFTENLQQISVSDTDMIALLRKQQAELEAQKAEVEAALAALAAQEAELEQKKVELAASIQAADNAISATEANLQANSAAYADNAEKQKAAQAEWAAWAASNNVGFEFTGGAFSWPIPGYTTLSSDFGTRRQIYGVWDVHRGMDIPAPAGTPIYAAADGQVSTSNHWSYGVSVKISHGSGLATIYGHMTTRTVSDGQMVAKGTQIGTVGSTGNSTGNHLHFEVNLNGQPVSAWPYLQG
ncbi:MAG: peptidoglycan DD-metalloendopeptidase family protein [Ruthenibacterium sp.]